MTTKERKPESEHARPKSLHIDARRWFQRSCGNHVSRGHGVPGWEVRVLQRETLRVRGRMAPDRRGLAEAERLPRCRVRDAVSAGSARRDV